MPQRGGAPRCALACDELSRVEARERRSNAVVAKKPPVPQNGAKNASVPVRFATGLVALLGTRRWLGIYGLQARYTPSRLALLAFCLPPNASMFNGIALTLDLVSLSVTNSMFKTLSFCFEHPTL